MNACAQAAGRACALVMSDGKFIEAGLLQVATQLGSRRQAAVRDSLITNMQRKLLSGL